MSSHFCNMLCANCNEDDLLNLTDFLEPIQVKNKTSSAAHCTPLTRKVTAVLKILLDEKR